jgi:hypothetical protein
MIKKLQDNLIQKKLKLYEHYNRILLATVPTLAQYQEDICENVVHRKARNRKIAHKTQTDRLLLAEIRLRQSFL